MLRNSIAHLVARISALVAGIVVIPLVTLTLGTEALGLVGVYATLQAMLGLFDLGLPVAANHRLAVMIGRNAAPVEKAVLVRTLETLFWALVALFLIIGFGLRGPLSESWLNVSVLPRATVDTALSVMIAAVAVRFPVAFYTNVLFAHERHVFPNAVTAGSAVLRILVSLIALVWLHVGIVGFFIIQLIGSVAEVVLLAGGVWRAQPHRWVAPRWAVLRDISAMAGGLTLVSLTAVMLSQVDKVILSKLLSLSDFGLYSAGYTLAAGLVALSYPVGNAVFPQLSRSLDGKSVDTKRIVQAATELTILILVPLGCVMIMQAGAVLDLLFLVKAAPGALAAILPLMMLGGIAQGFVTLPHLFQIAATRSHIVLWINVAGLVPYAILAWVFANIWGVWGAAVAFAVFNVARLLLHWGVLLMDPRSGPSWRGVPFMVSGITALALAVAWLADTSSAAGLIRIVLAVVTLIVIFAGAALILPTPRRHIVSTFSRPQSKPE